MFVSNCPRCQEPLRVPTAALPEDAQAQCPWCQETFSITELLDRLPPVVEVFSADGQPIPLSSTPAEATTTSGLVVDEESMADDSLDEHHELEPYEAADEEEWNFGNLDTGASESATSANADEQVSPMKVMPVPVSRRKKGSSIGTLLGVVFGGLAAVPIAGGILMLMGRTPDWGFWPFLGNNAGSNVTAAAPAPQQVDRDDSDRLAPSGRSLSSSQDSFPSSLEDPQESALQEIMEEDSTEAQKPALETSSPADSDDASAAPSLLPENAALLESAAPDAASVDAFAPDDASSEDAFAATNPLDLLAENDAAFAADEAGSDLESTLVDETVTLDELGLDEPASPENSSGEIPPETSSEIDGAVTPSTAASSDTVPPSLGGLNAIEETTGEPTIGSSDLLGGQDTSASNAEPALTLPETQDGMEERTTDEPNAQQTNAEDSEAIAEAVIEQTPDSSATIEPEATEEMASQPESSTEIIDQVAGEGQNLPATESDEVREMAEDAAAMLEELASFDGPTKQRRQLLARTYQQLAKTAQKATGNSRSLAELAEKIVNSPIVNEIEFAGMEWIRYKGRDIQGVVLIGDAATGNDDTAVLNLKNGEQIKLELGGAVTPDQRTLLIGKMTESDAVDVIATEPLP